MRYVLVLSVVLIVGSGWAREVRRPLPPRRPPISARTNVVRTVKAVRLAEETSPACVDVLMTYDRAAALWADWKGDGVTNFAEKAVTRMNEAVTNSNLSTSLIFRLAGVQVVDAQGGTDISGVLDAVTYSHGAWAGVQLARERFGADIAMILIDTGSAYGTTGLSWALFDTDYEAFADYAYGVCSVRAVAESHTLTHEVGHLFGAGHSDRQLDDPGPQLFSYSSGYYFETNGVPCHTIMAYDDDGYGQFYEEVPYFSTPEIALDGVSLGTASNDNVRTFRETAHRIAEFRTPGARSVDYALVLQEDPCSYLPSSFHRIGEVFALPSPSSLRRGPRTFAGWQCSNGKRYDGGMLVFNLAQPGEVVTMTAIWE